MTAIYNLISASFYLKLATTCKNLFLSLVVVVIFYFTNHLFSFLFISQITLFFRPDTVLNYVELNPGAH